MNFINQIAFVLPQIYRQSYVMVNYDLDIRKFCFYSLIQLWNPPDEQFTVPGKDFVCNVIAHFLHW